MIRELTGTRTVMNLFKDKKRVRSISMIGGIGTLISTGVVVYKVLKNRNKNLV